MVIFPLIILFILFMLNIPVAFCLMVSALSYFVFCPTGMPANMVIQRMVASAVYPACCLGTPGNSFLI